MGCLFFEMLAGHTPFQDVDGSMDYSDIFTGASSSRLSQAHRRRRVASYSPWGPRTSYRAAAPSLCSSVPLYACPRIS
eukprot:7414559-Prorocentrum_lima.AAC.1